MRANVVVLADGETVSINGTHLGHNLPDRAGNRYCIDVVCVAGTGALVEAGGGGGDGASDGDDGASVGDVGLGGGDDDGASSGDDGASGGGGASGGADGASGASGGGTVVLEDFSAPSYTWVQTNDPVMGGQSDGSFTVARGVGALDGTVRDVPFLGAPGFIKAQADGAFASVRGCAALALSARTRDAPPYGGYRLSFGDARGPDAGMYARGYKAGPIAFPETTGDAFATVEVGI